MFKTWWEDIKRIPYLDVRWVALWVTIYVSFLLLDIIFPDWPGTNLIKYFGIFLCVIYAYIKYRSDLMLIAALFFTYLADSVLVWTDWLTTGVYIFCIAQILHLARLSKINFKVIIVGLVIISASFAISVLQGSTTIYAIASIYALTLGCNLYFAYQRFNTNRNDFKSRCAFYGFAAFVCCDICVATRFLALQGYITPRILPVVNYLVWMFYYPSQVLIANSSMLPTLARKTENLRK